MNLSLTPDVTLDDGHAVCCEGSCFVRTDGGCVTHGLACIEMPDQVVVVHHFLLGKKSYVQA